MTRIVPVRVVLPVVMVSITLLLSVTNIGIRRSGSDVNNPGSYREFITGNKGKNDNSSGTRHVAFLKVHKCASTTILNILYRFGFKRNLNFVLPIEGNYIKFGSPRNGITVVPPPVGYDYDILCNHVYYFNKDNFAHYLPSDTVYFAIVREPFQRMQSSFDYYRNVQKFPFLTKLQGSAPFETYLSKPHYYESQWDLKSVTNNKMARDFGYPLKDYRNVSKFRNYLKFLDKTFHFVMVQELFEESLILLRRLLNWPMKEILFLVQNEGNYKTFTPPNNAQRIAPYLALDYMLYKHYLDKLKKKIKSEGQVFLDEVSYFRSINNKTTHFCNSAGKKSELMFTKNVWHGDFIVTRRDCLLMQKREIQFLNLVRDTQIEKLKTFGANVTKVF